MQWLSPSQTDDVEVNGGQRWPRFLRTGERGSPPYRTHPEERGLGGGLLNSQDVWMRCTFHSVGTSDVSETGCKNVQSEINVSSIDRFNFNCRGLHSASMVAPETMPGILESPPKCCTCVMCLNGSKENLMTQIGRTEKCHLRMFSPSSWLQREIAHVLCAVIQGYTHVTSQSKQQAWWKAI